MGLTVEKPIEKEKINRKRRSLTDMETIIERLEQRIEELEHRRPPELGWISQIDFCHMLGRVGKDGKRIPISRTTFYNLVKDSNGMIETLKVKNLVWVIKYPGQPSKNKSEAA